MPVQVIDQRSAAEWDRVLADIYRRHEAGEAQLAGIVAERRPLALLAAEGDEGAQARVAELNARHVELTHALDMLKNAADEASQHRREAAAREAAAEQAARLAEAEQVAEALVRCSEVVDEGFRAVVEALEKRRELAIRLSSLGFRRNGFHHVEPIARAAGAAGMRGHLPIIFGPMSIWMPLAQTDAGAVDALLSPARQARRAA
jgi:hypothetical protein